MSKWLKRQFLHLIGVDTCRLYNHEFEWDSLRLDPDYCYWCKTYKTLDVLTIQYKGDRKPILKQTGEKQMTFSAASSSGKWFRNPSMPANIYLRCVDGVYSQKTGTGTPTNTISVTINPSLSDYVLKVEAVEVTPEKLAEIFSQIEKVPTRSKLLELVNAKLFG